MDKKAFINALSLLTHTGNGEARNKALTLFS